MRVNEKSLDVCIIIDNAGAIESGHCSCMAGLGESCSHVGATLFALKAATDRDTSKLKRDGRTGVLGSVFNGNQV